MTTKQITVNVLEQANTREGEATFRKNSGGKVECLVKVEFDQNVGLDNFEYYIVTNAVLTDGVSILTSQEKTNLFNALKKIYDYAKVNIPNAV